MHLGIWLLVKCDLIDCQKLFHVVVNRILMKTDNQYNFNVFQDNSEARSKILK